MKREVFEKVMNEVGDAYIYYNRLDNKGGKTYSVATTDFSAETSPYIAKRWEQDKHRKQLQADEGSVVVFSYTNDRFRRIPLDKITRITPLMAEINRG